MVTADLTKTPCLISFGKNLYDRSEQEVSDLQKTECQIYRKQIYKKQRRTRVPWNQFASTKIAEVPGKLDTNGTGGLPLADAKGRDMSQFGAGNPGRELAGRGGQPTLGLFF